MLERLFGEERRRTKVIPHAFGERPVLKLMYAAAPLSVTRKLPEVSPVNVVCAWTGAGTMRALRSATPGTNTA